MPDELDSNDALPQEDTAENPTPDTNPYDPYATNLAENLTTNEKVAEFKTTPGQIVEKSSDLPVQTTSSNEFRQIGPYKLLHQVGEGGMGTVWMAEQQKPVRRRVALKLIKAEHVSREIVARFEAERQALAMMNHPNIAKVLDVGTSDHGMPYFVMELVQGVPITKYCDDCRLGIDDRLELFMQVCKGVQHAHQKAIIHRDLKPGNVMIAQQDGQPVAKIIDFGLAKALDHAQQLTDKTMFTRFGNIVGTLEYMSPEQADVDSDDIDTRTDVYSLGILLYELLTGTTPLRTDNMEHRLNEVLKTIREQEPPTPSRRLSSSGDEISKISDKRNIAPAKLQMVLRGELDWIVMKALDKDRTRRYGTVHGFSEDLERYLNNEPVIARPPSTVYKLKKFVVKNRGWVAAATTVALVLLGGIAGTSYGLIRSNHNAKVARENAEQERLAKEESQLQTRIALEATKRAEEVFDVFAHSFRSVDPNLGANADMSAKDVLIHAKARLETSELDPIGRVRFLEQLTYMFLKLGEPNLAIETGTEEVAIQRSLLGPANQDTLKSMNNLAEALRLAGRHEDAIDLHREVLNGRKQALGPNHPETLGSMSNLGLALSSVLRHGEAITLFQAALKGQRQILEPNHVHSLVTKSNLAHSLQAIGRNGEALELFQQVSEIMQQKFVVDDPRNLNALNQLAGAYWAEKQFDRAAEMFDKLVTAMESKHGRQHPDTQSVIGNLGVLYKELGRFDDSIALLNEVLETNKHLPHFATYRSQLRDVYWQSSRLDELKNRIDDDLKYARKVLPGGSPKLGVEMAGIAMNLIQLSEFERASKILEEVYQVFSKHGPDDWGTFNAQSLYGATLLGQQKFGEAKPALEKGYEGLKQRSDQIPVSVRKRWLKEAVERLVELAHKTTDEDALKKWNAELELYQ